MYSTCYGAAVKFLSESITRLRFPIAISINYHSVQLLVLNFILCTEKSYSTCLGRVDRWKNQNKLGFTNLQLPERLLELLKDDINGTNSKE